MPAVRAALSALRPAQPAAQRIRPHATLAGRAHDDRTLPCPKLLIVPHSVSHVLDPVSARAFARLAAAGASVRRVVLLGPPHPGAERALALPLADAIDTPLGRVAIDTAAREGLADLAQVVRTADAAPRDGLLAARIALLQAALGRGFRLLPIAVGRVDRDAVAQVVERLWGGDETVFVIGTDLSRGLPTAGACCTDKMTVARMLSLATDFDPFEACGAAALNGALAVARRRGLTAELIARREAGGPAAHRRPAAGCVALALTAPAAGTSALVSRWSGRCA